MAGQASTPEASRSRNAPRVDYGMDAPGVIRAFFLCATAALAAALLVPHLFPHHQRIAALLSGVLCLFTLATSFFGVLMLVYWASGKRRMRDRILATLLRNLPEREALSVLDVGTGRGMLAIAAAKHLPGAQVTALDIWVAKDLSGNSRDQALANAQAEGVGDRVHFRHEDIAATALPDASLDAVVSLLCLHNIEPAPQQTLALQAIARLLKPGGVALLADYLPTRSYGEALQAAGLTILSNETCFGTALSLMWMVTARKPHHTNAAH